MKINLKFIILTVLLLTGFAVSSVNAQIQLGLSGNYLIPTGEDLRFSDGAYGGGITGRYFVAPKFAVGLNGRFFSKTVENVGLKVKAQSIVMTGQAEYFFSESSVKPYVGAEAGLFNFKGTVEYLGESDSNSESYFGAAPKVGVQFMFSETVGLDINAGYQFIFMEGVTEKDILLGAGLVFTLGGK